MERVSENPQITIKVPRDWANNEHLDMGDLGLLRLIGNRKAIKEAEKKYKVNQKAREHMTKLGFNIVEVDYPINVTGEKEFTVYGELRSKGTELSFIEKTLGINVPPTITAEKFYDYPFFPVVAVNRAIDCGRAKYLIENHSQLNALSSFFNQYPGQMNNYLMKGFIETPSDRYTSYRIITSAMGDIMAAGLIYSQNRKSDNEIVKIEADKDFKKFFKHDDLELADSPYFLNSKKITSNSAQGGTVIPLNPTSESREITDEENEILEVHGIKYGQLPEKLAQNAKAIGCTIGKKLGLFVGIDFIQDKFGKFYYLETNSGPGMNTYLAAKNKGIGEQSLGYEMAMQEVMGLLKLTVQR